MIRKKGGDSWRKSRVEKMRRTSKSYMRKENKEREKTHFSPDEEEEEAAACALAM